MKTLCHQLEGGGERSRELHSAMKKYFEENTKKWPSIFANFKPTDKDKIKFFINFPFDTEKVPMSLI